MFVYFYGEKSVRILSRLRRLTLQYQQIESSSEKRRKWLRHHKTSVAQHFSVQYYGFVASNVHCSHIWSVYTCTQPCDNIS